MKRTAVTASRSVLRSPLSISMTRFAPCFTPQCTSLLWHAMLCYVRHQALRPKRPSPPLVQRNHFFLFNRVCMRLVLICVPAPPIFTHRVTPRRPLGCTRTGVRVVGHLSNSLFLIKGLAPTTGASRPPWPAMVLSLPPRPASRRFLPWNDHTFHVVVLRLLHWGVLLPLFTGTYSYPCSLERPHHWFFPALVLSPCPCASSYLALCP